MVSWQKLGYPHLGGGRLNSGGISFSLSHDRDHDLSLCLCLYKPCFVDFGKPLFS